MPGSFALRKAREKAAFPDLVAPELGQLRGIIIGTPARYSLYARQPFHSSTCGISIQPQTSSHLYRLFKNAIKSCFCCSLNLKSNLR